MGNGQTRLLVLCEGAGDRAFIEHMAEARGIAGIKVDWPANGKLSGKDAFGHRLKALAVQSDIETCGRLLIMADNDDDPAGRFAEVCAAIRAGGYEPPDRPKAPKRQNGLPQIEILMVPTTGVTGNLESLCYEAAIRRRPELKPCIEAFGACAEAGAWPGAKLAKLRLRCLIAAACQADPNRALQYCWAHDRQPKDLIPLDDPVFDPIAAYLRGII